MHHYKMREMEIIEIKMGEYFEKKIEHIKKLDSKRKIYSHSLLYPYFVTG